MCPCGAEASRAGSVWVEGAPTLRSRKASVVVEISVEAAVVCLYKRTGKSVLQQVYALMWFVVEMFHSSLIIFCITYKAWLKDSRMPHQLEFYLKIVWCLFSRQIIHVQYHQPSGETGSNGPTRKLKVW